MKSETVLGDQFSQAQQFMSQQSYLQEQKENMAFPSSQLFHVCLCKRIYLIGFIIALKTVRKEITDVMEKLTELIIFIGI